MSSIRFLGATGTVTGSKYLIERGEHRVLVDCGLFQGWKPLRERNWKPPRFDASSLDAVLLTHAHLDHTGYLPKLCQLGFSGPIYCTSGTRDLLQLLLPDAAHIQEEQARHANKWGYTKHHPAVPLFTHRDANHALSFVTPVEFGDVVRPIEGVAATYTRAGHIVGSSCIRLVLGDATITFTGDVGRPVDPIMKPPDPLGPTDFLVTESTYGDRRHPQEDVSKTLERIILRTAKKGGVILVPSFAVGRSQHLLRLIAKLKAEKRIPDIPTFLDSPMAIKATHIFREHEDDHKLSATETRQMCDAAQYTRTSEQSKKIDRRSGPMIIISASGMATGGRILHHLKRFLPDEKNAVVFVGYQAGGTRGRSLVDGADEIKMHGEYVPARAAVEEVRGLSSHADYREMLDWFSSGNLSPRRVFVTHGEPSAAHAFRRRIEDTFGWDAVVPKDGATWALEKQ